MKRNSTSRLTTARGYNSTRTQSEYGWYIYQGCTLPKFGTNVTGNTTKHTVGLVTAGTPTKKTLVNFHQMGYTCVVPPKGHTCAVPPRHVAAVNASDALATTEDNHVGEQ